MSWATKPRAGWISNPMARKRSLYDPFEITIAVVFGISTGMQFLFPPPPAGAAAAAQPQDLHNLWLALTLIGSLLILIGIAVRRVWGYIVEQVGLMTVGGTLVALGGQVLQFQIQHHLLSPATVTGGPLLIALGFGFLWKRYQVNQVIKAVSGVAAGKVSPNE